MSGSPARSEGNLRAKLGNALCNLLAGVEDFQSLLLRVSGGGDSRHKSSIARSMGAGQEESQKSIGNIPRFASSGNSRIEIRLLC